MQTTMLFGACFPTTPFALPRAMFSISLFRTHTPFAADPKSPLFKPLRPRLFPPAHAACNYPSMLLSRPRSACPLSIRTLSGFLLPVKIRFLFRLPRKSSLPFSPISYYSKPVLRSGCPPSAAFPGHRPARHPGAVCPLKAFRSQKKRPFNKSAFCHILFSKDQSKLYIKTNAKDNTPTAMPPILVMLFSLPSTVLDFILFA